jgi:acyl-CoA thioesterase-1
MMGCDMNDVVGLKVSRRAWLAHFTAVAAVSAAALSGASPFGAHAAVATQSKILVVGDSLSAEYGLERGSGWVNLLAHRLAQEKLPATVVNASISGDTTSGGRSRLAALLKEHRPTHVILELGANDALRGLPLSMTQDNLAEMAHEAKTSGARVVIVGMQVPPNYGRKYSDDFSALFAAVAKKEGAELVPFLLKGVADVPGSDKLFQADRIHPRAEAHPTILANVWPVLKPMLIR